MKQLDRENDLVSKIEEAKQHQKGRENSNSSYSSSENDVDETMTLASRVSQLSVRNKHESKGNAIFSWNQFHEKIRENDFTKK